jgi:hypothetical protein
MIKLKSLLEGKLNDTKPSRKIIAYHGTNALFKKFDLNMSTQGIIWFTSKKEDIANNNTGGYGSKYTITAELTINNPAGWDEYHKYSIGELIRDGYDSVILDSTEDKDFNYIMFHPKQIKIKNIEKTIFPTKITESTEEYRKDWLSRHNATIENNRVLAYHGTPVKNLKSIKANGFKIKTYFSLRLEYSKQIASTYHDVPENKVAVLKVWLPLDAIDFVMSDIYSTRVIKFEETL